VRAVLGIHIVESDHPGLTGAAGVQRNGCVECLSLPGEAGHLDANPALHPRRTIAAATAARATADNAATKGAAVAALKAQCLRAGAPCAFDEWTRPGGMWAGCLYGIFSRSSLCWLHHFLLGYCKYAALGFDTVFGTCANFSSPMAWRAAKAALARFIESQPCFDTGAERGRLVSLGNWSDITWWSGEAVFSSIVMTTAALQAFHWPLVDRRLQRRLIRVGVCTLQTCVLAVAPQQAVGGGAVLQACIEATHAAFATVSAEFGFDLDERQKPHNAVVHAVAAGKRIGVPAEFDGGAGIEAVHPRGKVIYDGSNKKGAVQEVVAKVISREEFAVTDLADALERARARLNPPAAICRDGDVADTDDDENDDDDDDDDDAHGTCAYATGALVPGMCVSSVSGQLPQLQQLTQKLSSPTTALSTTMMHPLDLQRHCRLLVLDATCVVRSSCAAATSFLVYFQ